ncbi:MAG: hypothetical protein PHG03_01255 [Bacilli bacterium]|nr:hypothetical protein [Bacilli bacterium]
MNIIVSNQNKIINTLNVDVIKTLVGEFSLDELNNELVNFYYNKIIVDITAIKNYYDISSTTHFLKGFDADRVIILLNDSEVVNSPSYLSKLVENGYYNFTRNVAGVNYLVNNPNSIEDVKDYIKEDNLYIPPKEVYIEKTIEDKPVKFKSNNNQIIIGIQNLTEHAGATTLAYMMVKQLKHNYTVKGIEMNKQDFIYFRDSDLSFCTSDQELSLRIKEFSKADVIIIDLNGTDNEEKCDEIVYLIDPGTIKLNKLLKKDSNIHLKMKDKKIILNRSSIKGEDIHNFEYETKIKVYFNIVNFNDRRERIKIIDEFLYKLGFKKQILKKTSFFASIFNKS